MLNMLSRQQVHISIRSMRCDVIIIEIEIKVIMLFLAHLFDFKSIDTD